VAFAVLALQNKGFGAEDEGDVEHVERDFAGL
jgi:hypothetical protein